MADNDPNQESGGQLNHGGQGQQDQGSTQRRGQDARERERERG